MGVGGGDGGMCAVRSARIREVLSSFGVTRHDDVGRCRPKVMKIDEA